MLTALLADIHEHDYISPVLVSRRLRVPMAELAKITHVHRNTLSQRPSAALGPVRNQLLRFIRSEAGSCSSTHHGTRFG